MNKKLHFHSSLIPLIISGKKWVTWRFYDDKDLSEGDIVDFLESGTERCFARAKITRVYKKKMGELTDEDKKGHENFNSEEEMYKTYKKYYNREITPQTVVKINRFKLINQLW